MHYVAYFGFIESQEEKTFSSMKEICRWNLTQDEQQDNSSIWGEKGKTW